MRKVVGRRSSRDPSSGGATQDFRRQDNRDGGRFLRRGTAARARPYESRIYLTFLLRFRGSRPS